MPKDSVGPMTFVIPEGWTRTVHSDGNVYASPVFQNGERCQLIVFGMRPAQGDLFDAAFALFREIFQAEPLTGYPMPDPVLFRGSSPLGWGYVIIRKSIRGQVGDYGNLLGTILLVAQIGSELGVIAATSKDPLVSMCFGANRDAWPLFFHSLRFAQEGADIPETVWHQALAGVWTAATGTVALRYAFAPSGRYAGAAAAQRRTPYSRTEVKVTTDAYFGDGAYAIEGNAITFTPDDGSGITRRFFRLEQQSKDLGRTWTDRLYLLTEGEGEVGYQR